MGYIKVVKNKSYYKKYKVKFRRRRECKTNYRMRRLLITQDKRKYNTPKWRFVVRITNRDVICQVVSAKMVGDQVLCAAYSHELRRFGLNVGLTNWAAAYATGLLCARRLLKKLGLDTIYKGKRELDGRQYLSRVENFSHKFEDGRVRRPFKCILDKGLTRATLGNRVFGAMKGAVDGGLDIPHSNKRFPGFEKKGEGEDKDRFTADVLRAKIYGEHVSDYMRQLSENDPDKYQKQFSQYIKEGIDADNLEDKYREVHEKIREDPGPWPKAERDYRTMDVRIRPAKLTYEQRIANRRAKIAEMRAAGAANADDAPQQMELDEDEED